MYDLEWCHGCLDMFEAGEDHETKDEDRQTYTWGQIWGSMVGWNMYCACFLHVCMIAFPFQDLRYIAYIYAYGSIPVYWNDMTNLRGLTLNDYSLMGINDWNQLPARDLMALPPLKPIPSVFNNAWDVALSPNIFELSQYHLLIVGPLFQSF